MIIFYAVWINEFVYLHLTFAQDVFNIDINLMLINDASIFLGQKGHQFDNYTANAMH